MFAVVVVDRVAVVLAEVVIGNTLDFVAQLEVERDRTAGWVVEQVLALADCYV